MAEQKVTVGRIVHFVMPGEKVHRPAIVVQTWSNDCVQLQVFLDGTNENCQEYEKTDNPGLAPTSADMNNGMMWRTSVTHDETGKRERTWHWPERD